MGRLKWGLLLSYISAHPPFIRTSHRVKSHHAILSTALTIFMLLGGWSTIIMPTYLDQALAAPLIATNHATDEQIATSNAELSTQDLQMAAGPEQVSLLNINLANSNIHFGVVEANNHLSGSGEVLSSMANRTGAIAGINGDFFDGMVDPIGLVEINGQIVQSPGYYAALGVTASGQITMDQETFSGSVTDGNATHVLNSINHHGDTHNGQLVLFTPALGASLPGLSDTIVTLQPVTDYPSFYTVQTIQSNATTLPVLSG